MIQSNNVIEREERGKREGEERGRGEREEESSRGRELKIDTQKGNFSSPSGKYLIFTVLLLLCRSHKSLLISTPVY